MAHKTFEEAAEDAFCMLDSRYVLEFLHEFVRHTADQLSERVAREANYGTGDGSLCDLADKASLLSTKLDEYWENKE